MLHLDHSMTIHRTLSALLLPPVMSVVNVCSTVWLLEAAVTHQQALSSIA
jgi:hypothetical protein